MITPSSKYGDIQYEIQSGRKKREDLKIWTPKLMKYGQIANNLRVSWAGVGLSDSLVGLY